MNINTKRVQRLLGHIHGGDVDGALWASLMDNNVMPDQPDIPADYLWDGNLFMRDKCTCARPKWNPVCTCARCAEFYGRGNELDFCSVAPKGLQPVVCKATGDGKEKSFIEGIDNVEIGGVQYMKKGNVIGSVDPSKLWRVGGIATFARLPMLYQVKHADVAIVGIPFDSGCSFRPGARFGPEAIRMNSRLIRPYVIKTQSMPLLDQQCADAGDIHVTPFNIAHAMEQIYDGLVKIQNDAECFVIIGGDHTLSYPAVKAAKERWGPIALIHFDAHLDTFPPQFGQDVWHGSPFRQCWKENLFAPDASVHVGIRTSTWSRQDLIDSDDMGIITLMSEDVHEQGVQHCVEIIKKRVKNHPVYLTIDIDVLDPSVAPATGTPEMGGLLAHQLLQFLRAFRTMNIISGDVVEVAPAYDHAGITSIAASNVVVEILTLLHQSPRKKSV
eukprot:GEMP01010947.1.p1 GENE.GEMP01010947.1~~GEMP01010947.1.p1  ORF type:complete len:456 (+),score=105.79 GEMP01010947.1:42-1370(+)